ncbi:MAG: L-seryl-tRNA(Sec) selenium transferase [Peptostreptococcaceae bacterium]|nr:L-seryl-tRNA(Sec) selenium transferase [Peptostreptococcaceae bacterium]
MNKNSSLRYLPKVDELLEEKEIREKILANPRMLVLESIREAIDGARKKILTGENRELNPIIIKEEILRDALDILKMKTAYNLRSVINATGVVLHTNLGRALLSESAVERIIQVAGNYSTLEYDLESGKRGLRYSHIEEIICKITGAEAAFVVNNNAAAVLLALNTLSEGKEAIVSRGQLVEIGGSFRIPDVMRQSGAILNEVGTTNKTHLRDYKENINENTGVLLKVHTSNYRILGFTQEVPGVELAELGRKMGIPLLEDIGSGTLIDFSEHGMSGEPTVQEAVKYADVVTFSGDKMLGGPQAGVIVGKKKYLDEMKKNPFTRAFRVDKLTIAGLEATFRHYLDPDEALEKVPTLRFLTASVDCLKDRAERLAEKIKANTRGFEISVEKGESQVGGGSMPLEKLPTYVVSIGGGNISASKIEIGLRKNNPPVIARINEEKVILDVRTIFDGQLAAIAEAFGKLSEEMNIQ